MMYQTNPKVKLKNQRKCEKTSFSANLLINQNSRRRVLASALFYYYSLAPKWAYEKPGLCISYLTRGADYDIVRAHLPKSIAVHTSTLFSKYHKGLTPNEEEQHLCHLSQWAARIEKQAFAKYSAGKATYASALEYARRSPHFFAHLVVNQLKRRLTDYENGVRLGVIGRPSKYVRGYLRCGQLKAVLDHSKTTKEYNVFLLAIGQKKLDTVMLRSLRAWRPTSPNEKFTIDEAATLFMDQIRNLLCALSAEKSRVINIVSTFKTKVTRQEERNIQSTFLILKNNYGDISYGLKPEDDPPWNRNSKATPPKTLINKPPNGEETPKIYLGAKSIRECLAKSLLDLKVVHHRPEALRKASKSIDPS